MKVIFIKNVKGVGKIDDVKEVADGYAENFLIRHGSAVRATPELLAQLDAKKKGAQHQQESQLAELTKKLAQIKHSHSVTIRGHAHSKNVLYQAITAQEIAHALHEQHDIFITKDLILNYDKPIKEVGEHVVTIGTKQQSIQYIVIVK